MNDDDVAQFLQQNPRFFESHPELLGELRLPNPHGGQAIALSERQVQALREENKAYKTKLQELVQFAEENDAIISKLHALALAVLPAASLPELLASLHLALRQGMSVPHTALRIWGGRPYAGDGEDREEFKAVGDAVKAHASGLGKPYCGPATDAELLALFGDTGSHVRSVAHLPIRDEGGACIGLLALGSEDVMRFYPEMGVVYLQRLGELASAALRRFV